MHLLLYRRSWFSSFSNSTICSPCSSMRFMAVVFFFPSPISSLSLASLVPTRPWVALVKVCGISGIWVSGIISVSLMTGLKVCLWTPPPMFTLSQVSCLHRSPSSYMFFKLKNDCFFCCCHTKAECFLMKIVVLYIARRHLGLVHTCFMGMSENETV